MGVALTIAFGCQVGVVFGILASLLLSLVDSELVSRTGNGTAESIHISYFPPQVSSLFEKAEKVIWVNLTLPKQHNWTRLRIKSRNPKIALVSSDSSLTLSPNAFEYETNFTARGRFLGRTKFDIYMSNESDNGNGVFSRLTDEFSIEVTVFKPDSIVRYVFTAILSAVVCLNTFMVGMQLDWRVIVHQLRHPAATLLGVTCQFTLMPLIAFFVGWLLLADHRELWLGYFAAGCSPGGTSSSFWSYLLELDVELSVAVTFCSIVASLFMLPLWLFTLGQMFIYRNSKISIPFWNVVTSLFALALPVGLGMLVRQWRPGWAERSRRYLTWTTLVVLVLTLTLGNYISYYIYLLFTWRTVLCGCLLPWLGFGCSVAVCAAFQCGWRTTKTLMLNVAMQNGGIPIILLLFSLPKPDSDISIVMPISIMIFRPWPLLLWLLVVAYRSWTRKRKVDVDAPKDVLCSSNCTPSSLQPSQLQAETASNDQKPADAEPFSSDIRSIGAVTASI